MCLKINIIFKEESSHNNLQVMMVVVVVQIDPYVDSDDDDGKTPSDDGHLLHQVRGITVEDDDECEIHVPRLESHPGDRSQQRVVEKCAKDFAPDIARVTELADSGVGEEDEVHEEKSGHEVEQDSGAAIAPELSEISRNENSLRHTL